MSEKKEELIEARGKINELLSEVGLELNGGKFKRLTILWRRVAWLKKRIANANEEGKVLHYDKKEAMATEWAVNHIVILEEEIKRLREEIADLKKEKKNKQSLVSALISTGAKKHKASIKPITRQQAIS